MGEEKKGREEANDEEEGLIRREKEDEWMYDGREG